MSTGIRRIVLVDFKDSFTYNIFATLSAMGVEDEVEVIDWEKAALYFKDKPKDKVIIYGPGPGHPEEYSSLFQLLAELLQRTSLFHLGICLGHQILWTLRGLRVKRSLQPLHGQSVPFFIPPWQEYFESDWIGKLVQVQRYNSLALDLAPAQGENFSFSGGECMAGKFPRGLTYQFHPESIGTSCPEVFFQPVLRFLNYNGVDGKGSSAH